MKRLTAINLLIGICMFILSAIVTGCCYGVKCGPCPGPMAVIIVSPIIQFDISAGNFQLEDIDTLLLFKYPHNITSKIPSDTFFNIKNNSTFTGVNLDYNMAVSDQTMNQIIKIDNLKYEITEFGKGCCGCDKYEVQSIAVNDTVYLISKLPVLIHKK